MQEAQKLHKIPIILSYYLNVSHLCKLLFCECIKLINKASRIFLAINSRNKLILLKNNTQNKTEKKSNERIKKY